MFDRPLHRLDQVAGFQIQKLGIGIADDPERMGFNNLHAREQR